MCIVIIHTLLLFLIGFYVPMIFAALGTGLFIFFFGTIYLIGIIVQMVFRFNTTLKKLNRLGISAFIFMCIIAILFFTVPGGAFSYPITNWGLKLHVKMNGGYENLYSWAQGIVETYQDVEITDGVYDIREENWSEDIKNIVKHGDVVLRVDREKSNRRYVEIFYGHNKPGYWGIVIGKEKSEDSPCRYYYFKWNNHIYAYFHDD